MSIVAWHVRRAFATEEIGITGDVDLRGRLLPVLGVEEKASVAMREGMELFIVPSECFKTYQAHDFNNLSDDPALIDYARRAMQGADTMLDVIHLVMQGE